MAERRSGGRCSGSRHGGGSEPNSGRVWRTGSTLTWTSWSRWSRRSGALERRSRSQPQGPRRPTRVARWDSRAQAPRSDEFARICPTEWKLVIRLLQRLCRSPVSYEGSSRLRVVAGKRLVTAQIAPSMLHSVGGAGIAGVKNRARVDGREVLQIGRTRDSRPPRGAHHSPLRDEEAQRRSNLFRSHRPRTPELGRWPCRCRRAVRASGRDLPSLRLTWLR